MREDHISTARQVHRTITTIMPLLTAAIAVSGAVLASMEQKRVNDASLTLMDAKGTTRKVGAGDFIVALLMLLIKMVALAAVLVAVGGALYYGDTTVRAVTITATVFALMFLAERKARGFRRLA